MEVLVENDKQTELKVNNKVKHTASGSKIQFDIGKRWKISLKDLQEKSIMLTRDALQHLPLDYSCRYLTNIWIGTEPSGANNGENQQFFKNNLKYLLVGSYYTTPIQMSPNIELGDCFAINLKNRPFSITPNYGVLKEGTSTDAEKKELFVVNLKSLPPKCHLIFEFN